MRKKLKDRYSFLNEEQKSKIYFYYIFYFVCFLVVSLTIFNILKPSNYRKFKIENKKEEKEIVKEIKKQDNILKKNEIILDQFNNRIIKNYNKDTLKINKKYEKKINSISNTNIHETILILSNNLSKEI